MFPGYRWYFRAHSRKSLERNILEVCGIKPVKETLIGMVGALEADESERRLSLPHRRALTPVAQRCGRGAGKPGE